MGALHEGHLSLMRRAKLECGEVAVSIFVNPTQFGKAEDFESYPRDEKRDVELAESVGVDWVFAPTAEEMYSGNTTTVKVSGVTERWEGEFRPGHFDGVCTVVNKLFNIVQPDVAYFGLKDLQQCACIARMIRNLNFPVELRLCETVREKDGLAMSSRNAHLSPVERKTAPYLYEAISDAAKKIRCAEGDTKAAKSALDSSIAFLQSKGFRVDYLAYVDRSSMEPLLSYSPDGRVIVAARLGGTRLIDNCVA